MSARVCSMVALVEASRDGRLGRSEAASVERHLAGCTTCAALARDLDRLGRLARAPLARTSELDRRRARVRLLQRAAAPAPHSSRRGLAIVVAVSLFALSAVAAAKFAPWSPRGALATPGAPIPVASSGARLKILAARAAAGAEIAASPLSPADAARAVDAGATSGVAGSVDLASIVQQSPLATASASVVGASSNSGSAASRHGARGGHAAPEAPASAPSTSSASAFAEAVNLVERGDYGAATERLEAFQQAHKKDPRAEDAAFLAVVALERAGRRAEAVRAARAYLAAYPDGFRRAEAEAIAAGDRPRGH